MSSDVLNVLNGFDWAMFVGINAIAIGALWAVIVKEYERTK